MMKTNEMFTHIPRYLRLRNAGMSTQLLIYILTPIQSRHSSRPVPDGASNGRWLGSSPVCHTRCLEHFWLKPCGNPYGEIYKTARV